MRCTLEIRTNNTIFTNSEHPCSQMQKTISDAHTVNAQIIKTKNIALFFDSCQSVLKSVKTKLSYGSTQATFNFFVGDCTYVDNTARCNEVNISLFDLLQIILDCIYVSVDSLPIVEMNQCSMAPNFLIIKFQGAQYKSSLI